MREILFRGKTLKGEWVCGSLHIEYGWRVIEGKRQLDHIIYDVNGQGDYVAATTIGQYTGLTANGKKIFEGDIINIEYPDTIIRNAFVNYIGASFCGDNGFDLWELDGYVSLEVVGNIHDNPELLKGE